MNFKIFMACILRSVVFNRLLRILYRNTSLSLNIKRRLKKIFLHPSVDFNESDLLHGQSSQSAHHKATLSLVTPTSAQFDSNALRILIIDYQVPMPDQNSGSVRMLAIMRLLIEMGFRITFIGNRPERLLGYEETLEKQGINLLHGFDQALRHLKAVGHEYYCVLLSRPEIAFRYLPYVRTYAPCAFTIYDTVDLHWIRCKREMQVTSNKSLIRVIERFRRMELLNTVGADLVLAITDEEKNQLLAERPDANVMVLSNIHEASPPKTSFNQRKGLLFIGGFLHKPNEDAVIYFASYILPIIIKQIPDIVFYIIGSNMPASVKSLHSANIEPLGFVADVVPHFESCRVFVAPLRFGAGMKGKIGQSMSHGLPIVTTQIGAEGMGLVHGRHALIAEDPQDFSNSVVRLYKDEGIWTQLSKESLSHLEANYSLPVIRKQMAGIFFREYERVGQVDAVM